MIASLPSSAHRQPPVTILNRLSALVIDAQRGFARAATAASDLLLARKLFARSEQRAEFVEALGSNVRGLGGVPATQGTFAGPLHRVWIATHAVVGACRDASLLDDCLAAEDILRKRYAAALQDLTLAGASEKLRDIVEAQYDAVRDTEDELVRLRMGVVS
jgi:uncharacterized protein (TIGR02284 family)